MSKLIQTKINLKMENGNLESTEGVKNRWKLFRVDDGLIKESEDITWVEWDENGYFKARHNEPSVGYTLLMSPFSLLFAWQTTIVTELIERKDNYLKFKTKNSTYELYERI
jgi:hypothetical protein